MVLLAVQPLFCKNDIRMLKEALRVLLVNQLIALIIGHFRCTSLPPSPTSSVVLIIQNLPKALATCTRLGASGFWVARNQLTGS